MFTSAKDIILTWLSMGNWDCVDCPSSRAFSLKAYLTFGLGLLAYIGSNCVYVVTCTIDRFECQGFEKAAIQRDLKSASAEPNYLALETRI